MTSEDKPNLILLPTKEIKRVYRIEPCGNAWGVYEYGTDYSSAQIDVLETLREARCLVERLRGISHDI